MNWHPIRTRASLVLSAFLGVSCGGGGNPEVAEPPIQEVTGQGALVRVEPLSTLKAQDFRQGLAAPNALFPNAQPLYDVKVWRVRYMTLDGQGQAVEASGLMGIPVKPAGALSPIVSYQHGTIFKDAQAPSNNPTATEPALLIASMGFIAVASDYVGYGASKGKEHPYLMATPTANAVVDMLTATRIWRQRQAYGSNGQLFLMGYSEGGYATLAAHRKIQTDKNVHMAQLTGAVPGAGPYHVGETMNVLLARVRDQNPVIAGLLSPGLLKNLGTPVRNEVRKQLVKALIPSDADVILNTTFIDYFLADDNAALDRDCNLHDWAPAQRVDLLHGKDDQTVPYASSTRTLQAMQSRGAPKVSLTSCPVTPSGHIECVPAYFDFAVTTLKLDAKDL